ncbi:YigZ family protein [Streptococcus phocae subsp. salmonis]|uniref:YigZ family protein n=1 Tax=Streptococcus phocae TaxID=119224 RepID=UPI000530E354|nr:YigZ family protein [Streptococcus phocae]KGR72219.1 Xaa-Pro dipeptidase [Streptococcus phocae subsp. salmonis]
MENYQTIMADGSLEKEIKKSRFICQLKRITTEEEGKAFIAAIKKKHYKATHSCSAMIIGEKSHIKRSSDDGEPSGTAGVPMLSVLEKQELTNLVVVVTRYFGGVKLGTGGLIRAYGGVTSEAIEAVGIVQVKEQAGLELTLSYPQYQVYSTFLEQEGLVETDTQFAEQVRTLIYFDPERKELISQALIDYYHGKVSLKIIPSQIIDVVISPGTLQ